MLNLAAVQHKQVAFIVCCGAISILFRLGRSGAGPPTRPGLGFVYPSPNFFAILRNEVTARDIGMSGRDGGGGMGGWLGVDSGGVEE
jgi:hypothetical protein